MRREIERSVFGVAVTAPRESVDLSPETAGDGFTRVRGVVERDHDFHDPTVNAREAARKVVRLVLGDDDDG